MYTKGLFVCMQSEEKWGLGGFTVSFLLFYTFVFVSHSVEKNDDSVGPMRNSMWHSHRFQPQELENGWIYDLVAHKKKKFQRKATSVGPTFIPNFTTNQTRPK